MLRWIAAITALVLFVAVIGVIWVAASVRARAYEPDVGAEAA